MPLLSLKESINLNTQEFGKYFSQHINPGLLNIYRLLGTSDMDIESAQGLIIRLKNGKKILDFTSALGITGLGHNHPKIIAAEQLCHEKKIIDAIKTAPHKLQAALAYNLAQLLPDPLQISFFAVSGAEAIEGAMKLCEKVQGTRKKKFITTSGAYHGKTHGAISLTTNGGLRDSFIMGISKDNIIEIPYGDINTLEQVLSKYSDLIVAMVLESIQGQSVVVPPPGYLKNVVEICHKYGALVIFDEIKAGMGRSGKFCAFEHENTVPDVITLSKALGGGKRAISAFVTTEKLFKKAYGKRKECNTHSTTFGGLGESCAVAIETLKVLEDENLISEAAEKGDYLIRKLEALKERYPKSIKAIKGRGLLLGIQFNYEEQLIKRIFPKNKLGMNETVDSLFIASIVRELYRKYDILSFFASNDTLQVMPPLIVTYNQMDQFIEAINGILETGFSKLSLKLLKSNLI